MSRIRRSLTAKLTIVITAVTLVVYVVTATALFR